MAGVGQGGVVHVVEHVPGHLPVLVGGGVAEHGPHQDDADCQESHGDTEQRPLGFARSFLQGFAWR